MLAGTASKFSRPDDCNAPFRIIERTVCSRPKSGHCGGVRVIGRYPDTRALTVVWANVSVSSPSDPHLLGTSVVSSLWYLAGVYPRGCGAASVTANVNRNPKNSIYDAVSSVRFWAYSVEKVRQPNFVTRRRSERSSIAGLLSRNFASLRRIERKLLGFQKRRLFQQNRACTRLTAF